MTRSKREWLQCELKLSPGAEPWVIVRHRRGAFRLPLAGSIETVLAGIAEGWTMDQRKPAIGGLVKISRARYAELVAYELERVDSPDAALRRRTIRSDERGV